MQLRTDVPNSIKLPATILLVDVSYCAFSSSSFKSLIEMLTCRPAVVPFIFQAEALIMKAIAYSALQELDFAYCNPNMYEIDWNGNHIPKESMKFFFAFLFSQKRSHVLIMNDVIAGDMVQFLSFMHSNKMRTSSWL